MERDRETKEDEEKRPRGERGRGRRGKEGTSLVVQQLRFPSFHCRRHDFNPSQGTKILHAML